MISNLTSLLTSRAPEGGAPVLSEPLHGATTAARPARLALAIVDLKRVLEIAELARGLAMVAQRRAARLNRGVQHGADRNNEPHGMVGWRAAAIGQRGSLPFRRQMRAKQRLADIDVAKPSDDALVEQRRLQRSLFPRAGLRQHGGIKRIAERFRAERLEKRFIVEIGACDDLHVAEAARIVERDHGAIVHLEHDMVVGRVLATRKLNRARRIPVTTLRSPK